MEAMSSSTVEPADFLDLKLLPAWVREPAEARNYEHYTGEEEGRGPRGHSPRDKRDGGGKRRPANIQSADGRIRRGEHPIRRRTDSPRRTSAADKEKQGGLRKKTGGREYRPHEAKDRLSQDRHAQVTGSPLEITIRFLPYSPAFENVVAQIKSGSVAYSLFALARLFLEKPERYEVRLTAKAESLLYQMGENGSVSLDQEFLERNAFRFAHEDFYKIDITQSDPIKGNFSNVARCRLSGTLLGPTNHHNYQPQLRSLNEQRFSRLMSLADYQRQIEI